MSDQLNEQTKDTISTVAIDKTYLLGTLKLFDNEILEKKYSFKVDGDPVNGIKVPDTVAENNGTTFQYIGNGSDNKNLHYGYFYKVVSEKGTLTEYTTTYLDEDEVETTDKIYLSGDRYLWRNSGTAYSPINEAKFSEITKEGVSTIVYEGHEYTEGAEVTDVDLSGYLAINTQPDAAEPITYFIQKDTDASNENSSDIVYQLWQKENGVESVVADSVIRIPKNKLLSNAVLISGIHKGDATGQDPDKYYSPDYENDNVPLPDFNNPDSTGEGDTRVYDTYIMLSFDVDEYDGSEDKSYIYISTKSLIDDTDFGYGLSVSNDGKFNVTTQVLTLPGSDIVDSAERQSYLSNYAGDSNKPKIVQLITDGLFYKLVEDSEGTYTWEYITPVRFEGADIDFNITEFQIGADEQTTDAGTDSGTDDSGD